MRRPSISFIGSGNVAWHLAQAFSSSGFEVAEVFGRNKENTGELALLCGAKAKALDAHIETDADLLFLCIPDQAIIELLPQINKLSAALIHTAGTLEIEEIRHENGYGVFYPLQTFTKGFSIPLHQVPILLEASDESVYSTLEILAKAISERVEVCDSSRRKFLHMSAVWASNYSNHMMEIASLILKEKDLPFELLKELILETTRKALTLGPHEAQTGPALRRDEKTMEAHMELLDDELSRKLYQLIASSIQARHPRD